jgi:pimeloyl-ACP methyl ester carboxylesterase
MGGQVGTLWEERIAAGASVAPLWGELRYGAELAQLLASSEFQSVERREDAPPVLLIPGFMAGDGSLAVMRQWLRRRGHQVKMSGIRTNVGCAGALVGRLEQRLQELAEQAGEPVFVIGQSRGGSLARSLAVRNPDAVAGLAMLGSPIVDALAVSGGVLRTVRWVAALGDRGLPGVFSSTCAAGDCCAEFRAEQAAPLPDGIPATALYSLSDGIVDWRACVDPHARGVAVQSSHCGMSVNVNVYRVLDRALDAGR